MLLPGERLTDRDWVDERDRALCHSLYGLDSVQKMSNLDDWENALIALDEYKEMDLFAQICEAYIRDESLEIALKRCAERLRKF